MKPFINKFLYILVIVGFISGCTQSQEEPSVQLPQTTPSDISLVEEANPVEPKVEPVVPVPAKTPVKKEKVSSNIQQINKQTKSDSDETILRLKEWDKNLQTLQTRFEQSSVYDGVPISFSNGRLFYKQQDHLLRLDTLDKDGDLTQTAVTDKQKILILDNQGHEITNLSWNEWQQGQPNQALFDFGNYTALLARHNIKQKEPFLLELTPKEGEEYTLYLTLSEKDYFPTTIKIVSGLMTTEAKLLDTQKNGTLAFDIFRTGGFFK